MMNLMINSSDNLRVKNSCTSSRASPVRTLYQQQIVSMNSELSQSLNANFVRSFRDIDKNNSKSKQFSTATSKDSKNTNHSSSQTFEDEINLTNESSSIISKCVNLKEFEFLFSFFHLLPAGK